jgi:hypothetical protein
MQPSTNKKGLTNIILVGVLVIIVLFVISIRKCNEAKQHYPERTVTTTEGDWRHHKTVYTSHARCRMECRDISEAEVEYILENGVINEEKSKEADAEAEGNCLSYALEGKTKDGQHVRIIFGACDKITKVITAIDLDSEQPCNCR